MDNGSREDESQNPRQQNIRPSKYVFFLNNELVRLVHKNHANNICTLYNFIQNKEQSMLLSDFKKHRKRAYLFVDVTRIFKRSRLQIENMIKAGLINPPVGATIGGARAWQKKSYYSEDDLFKIREAMSTIHVGRPRKDGRITPSKKVPSEKQLRSLIGDAIMLYTKTKDGEFIPVWAEETW